MAAKNKLTFGLKRAAVAPLLVDADTGAVTFGAIEDFDNATEITLSPVGDNVKKYALDKLMVTIPVNQGYEGNLMLFDVPSWFKIKYLGYKQDETSGAIVEDANAAAVPFALLFEQSTEVNGQTVRVVLYNCTALRPSISAITKEETVDPQPVELPIVAGVHPITFYPLGSVIGDSTNTVWAGWFTNVWVKGADSGGA